MGVFDVELGEREPDILESHPVCLYTLDVSVELYLGIDVPDPAEFDHAIYPLDLVLDVFPNIPEPRDAAHAILEFINGPLSALVFAMVAAATAFERHFVCAVPQSVRQAPFVGEHADAHELNVFLHSVSAVANPSLYTMYAPRPLRRTSTSKAVNHGGIVTIRKG